MKKPFFNDVNAANNFEKEVSASQMKCNQLISIFETFQPFQRIMSHDDWMILVTDPVKTFDDLLVVNVNLKVTGNMKIDPAAVAKMISVDRENYLNLTAGKPLKTDCEPCKKISIKNGQTAISLSEYLKYSDFLLFEEGLFSVNQAAVDKHKKTFEVFAESPAAIELLNRYENLVKVLNDAITFHKVDWTNVDLIAKIFDLLSYQGKVMINEFEFQKTIKHLNSQKS